MAEKLTGWQPDPWGIHEFRYFSMGGIPTRPIRDGSKAFLDTPPRWCSGDSFKSFNWGAG